MTGIVQGVFYRSSTKRQADELGLAGTVRNLPDGSVEGVCEGDEKKIERLIEWCRTRPARRLCRERRRAMARKLRGLTGFSIVLRLIAGTVPPVAAAPFLRCALPAFPMLNQSTDRNMARPYLYEKKGRRSTTSNSAR